MPRQARPIAPGKPTESFAPLGPDYFRGLFHALTDSVRADMVGMLSESHRYGTYLARSCALAYRFNH
jgi:hypothetical protein